MNRPVMGARVVLGLALLCQAAARADVISGTHTLLPKTVDADALRWRDIEGDTYHANFRNTFSYAGSGSVAVDWLDNAQSFTGTLTATTVKPNFAYQMKLVGRVPITSAAEPPPPDTDPEGWASWQIGHAGRWWDETDQWNLSDAELAGAIAAGHDVVGYLLFDFFITDADGNATKAFALDSSYHVLWRTAQRARGSNDSAVVNHTIERGAYAYNVNPPETGNTVDVYAEWEPDRPTPGTLELPYGVYPVTFNITEESFHDNMGTPVPFGGFWAQVLEGDFTFEIWPLAVRWPR